MTVLIAKIHDITTAWYLWDAETRAIFNKEEIEALESGKSIAFDEIRYTLEARNG